MYLKIFQDLISTPKIEPASPSAKPTATLKPTATPTPAPAVNNAPPDGGYLAGPGRNIPNAVLFVKR